MAPSTYLQLVAYLLYGSGGDVRAALKATGKIDLDLLRNASLSAQAQVRVCIRCCMHLCVYGVCVCVCAYVFECMSVFVCLHG